MTVENRDQFLNLKDQIRTKSATESSVFNDLIIERLEKLLEFDEKLFSCKLSGASDRIPLRIKDYYYRCASLLKLLVERPHGIKKLRVKYSGLKRNSVRPPVRKLAWYYPLVHMLQQMCNKSLLTRIEKGFVTSEKGKALICECLKQMNTS